ncbi:hypothetical protein BUM88_06570 [Acinetobacter calcoaceticus]|uniref:hypothetical protein n=1 Tax=Acinetobacter calcoaceticus TaxID=471 RepID=UPI0009AF11B2|nr:hypothetical protein [Acinetobacter calcoaceticus]AQZ81292.1 hypothetical protein BUM88_06570 [Acinetobacter calcoaceticus]
MKIRLSLRFGGDNFNHQEIVDSINTDFIYEFYNCEDYSYFTFFHPKGISSQYPDNNYEEDFIFFIEENYEKLFQYGIRSFDLFIEVYYVDQCNFEILNSNRLKRLSQFNISMPISVYHEDENGNLL